MIPTFIIDAPTLMLFGALFARLNTENLAGTADILSSRWFKRGLGLSTVFILTALWSYRVAPDWMWMYYLPESRVSVLDLIYILFFLYYLPYLLGYVLGIWAEQKQRNLSLLVMGTALALNLYIVAATFTRYRVVGTRADFEAGTAASLFGPNPVSLPMNAGGAVLVVLGIYYLVRFFRERRAAA